MCSWQLGPPSFAALQTFALWEWVIVLSMKYLSMQAFKLRRIQKILVGNSNGLTESFGWLC